MESAQSDNLDIAIIDTVAVDNLVDVSASLLDATVISAFEVGTHAFENIPFLGAVAKFYKVGVAVSQQLFIKKLGLFLSELDRIPTAERATFVHGLQQDAAFQKKVGENLILLIDRVDDLEKVSILAKLFGFYITQKISYLMFRRLAIVIDRVFLPDLLEVINTPNIGTNQGFTASQESDLVIQGMLSVGVVDTPVRILRNVTDDLGNYLHTAFDTQVSWTQVGKELYEILRKQL